MKVRACVLIVCMTVVPGLAMFSHHVPSGVRQAARCHLWQPVADWLRPAEPDSASVPAPAPAGPLGAAAPAPASSSTATMGRPAAVDRLVALGAVEIEVRPLDGASGVHVASCRVAMDAAGQLHRVFQAPGPDPREATLALAEQVEAWRDRLAARAMAADQAPGPL
jgi:hypothetical protein